MDIGSAFPSKWLKHSDLQGKRFTLTIKQVVIEDMQDGEPKPIMYFTQGSKGLVLNKTNATEIANSFGTETDQWAGKQIEMFPSTTLYMGKTTPCIRVRPVHQATPTGLAVAQAMVGVAAAVAKGPFDEENGDAIPF